MTAKEFLKSKEPNTFNFPEEWLIEFAQYHTERALLRASEKAKLRTEGNYGTYENPAPNPHFEEKDIIKRNTYGHGDCTYEIITVSKHSIMNAYHLSNIK